MRSAEAHLDDESGWYCVALWDDNILVRRDAFPTYRGALRVMHRWVDHGMTKGWAS